MSAARLLLGLFFMVAGALHFVFPARYASVMPPWLPAHAALVAISGVCEFVGGLGVLMPSALLRRLAGWGLIALSIAVLPANVQMLINALQEGRPGWQIALLLVRLPLQAAIIWWIWRVAVRPGWKNGTDPSAVSPPANQAATSATGD
jgi:uncharacterized membrane protein